DKCSQDLSPNIEKIGSQKDLDIPPPLPTALWLQHEAITGSLVLCHEIQLSFSCLCTNPKSIIFPNGYFVFCICKYLFSFLNGVCRPISYFYSILSFRYDSFMF
ncbi:mCG145240, partial [Mus musculus]